MASLSASRCRSAPDTSGPKLSRFRFGKRVEAAVRAVEHTLSKQQVEIGARNTNGLYIPWPDDFHAVEQVQYELFFSRSHDFYSVGRYSQVPTYSNFRIDRNQV